MWWWQELEGEEKTAEVKDRIKRLKMERGFAAREKKDQLDLKRKADEQRLSLEAEREKAKIAAYAKSQDQEHEVKLLAQMKDWSEDKILAWFSQRSESSANALAETRTTKAGASCGTALCGGARGVWLTAPRHQSVSGGNIALCCAYTHAL